MDTNVTSTKISPILIAITVSIATFMEVLDTTIVSVSLNAISGNLSATQSESTWAITSYLVANGIVLSLAGWLSGIFGRKNYFLISIAAFTITSLGCGLSTSLPMLVAFRLLQGIAGGGLQPMQMSIMMDAFPPEKRGSAFAISGMTMVVAPILGPTLGGWITDNFDWRWIFFINIPVGILSFWLTKKLVEDYPHTQAQGIQKIDYIGLTLIIFGLGCLQIVLDKGQEVDWFDSQLIILCSIISVISLITAYRWLLKQENPIVDIRLLSIKSFAMPSIIMFFMGFALYGSSTLLPLMVQSLFGYDATLAGLVLSPGALSVVLLMPLIGKFSHKFQIRYQVMIGMLLLGSGLWMTSLATLNTDYRTFVYFRILQVFGLPFLFIPCGTLAFSEIPMEKSSNASSLYSLIRNIGGSIGISVVLSYASQRQQFYQHHLVDHLNSFDFGYQQWFNQIHQHFLHLGHTLQEANQLATLKIYNTLFEQSMIITYCNTFKVMAITCFCVAIIALWTPNLVSRLKSNAAIH